MGLNGLTGYFIYNSFLKFLKEEEDLLISEKNKHVTLKNTIQVPFKVLALMARLYVVLFASLIERFMTQVRSLLMHRAQLNQG